MYSNFAFITIEGVVDYIDEISNLIDPLDLDHIGFEKNTHITLSSFLYYNLLGEDINKLDKNKLNIKEIKLGKITSFETKKFDVLKIDVLDDNVFSIHDYLDFLPHTDPYGKWSPHVTLCFLKCGTSKKYIDILNKKIKFNIFKSKKVVFSRMIGEGLYDTKDILEINRY